MSMCTDRQYANHYVSNSSTHFSKSLSPKHYFAYYILQCIFNQIAEIERGLTETFA